MRTVAVVNYGMGNVGSVARALDECGARAVVTDDPEALRRADRIVLPGVGAFGDAMARIRERGLDAVLRELVIDGGTPFLGVCLGMQLLADRSFEGGATPGLGWIPGDVRRLSPSAGRERVPHVGWNQVRRESPCPLFDDTSNDADFYFVHSYHFDAAEPQDVVARTPYCGSFVSAVARGNIFGVQFHPEKSQQVGLRLLRSFLAV